MWKRSWWLGRCGLREPKFLQKGPQSHRTYNTTRNFTSPAANWSTPCCIWIRIVMIYFSREELRSNALTKRNRWYETSGNKWPICGLSTEASPTPYSPWHELCTVLYNNNNNQLLHYLNIIYKSLHDPSRLPRTTRTFGRSSTADPSVLACNPGVFKGSAGLFAGSSPPFLKAPTISSATFLLIKSGALHLRARAMASDGRMSTLRNRSFFDNPSPTASSLKKEPAAAAADDGSRDSTSLL